MNARLRKLAMAVALPAVVVVATPAVSTADSAMEDVLAILKKEGIIDQGQQDRLMAKYNDEQKKAEDKVSGLLSGMDWYGDLRLRHETIRFSSDGAGVGRDNRYRLRYRARFGFQKKVGDRLKVGVRLASGSGSGDARSTNVTFGGSKDFAPDGIFFDRAWVSLNLQDEGGLKTDLVGGRVANPYTWKNGKDFLVFDGDLNMQGLYLTSSYQLNEDTRVFGTIGTFIARENGGKRDDDTSIKPSSDPKLFALQAGTETSLGGAKVGFRLSGYEWRSLDSGFISNGMANGNLAGAFDNQRARMGEAFTYAKFGGGEWPVTLYGTFVRNFNADSVVVNGISSGDEEDAYGVGVEVGDAKKVLKLGAGWFRVEANSVAGQFYDSDLFDGITNRVGFIVYASRRVYTGTDISLTFFDGQEIESDGGLAGPFAVSIRDADRRRLQADVIVKF